jgi:peptidoglycan/LPS O-acetylase OafA/YrhL
MSRGYISATPAHGLPSHLPYLDGIRGIAALWVLVAHTQILTGMWRVFLLSYGHLAVDLFILMSGLLMTHHYLLRRAKEPWEKPGTWAVFWVRRFFRIAPLYYVLLALALLLGPELGHFRELIAAQWPDTATAASRYHDQTTANVLTHVSFIFGLLPHYAYDTPLPDWSIGLEMEFYVAFPFLMLLMARVGPLKAAGVSVLGCLALKGIFPAYFAAFEMPSVLAEKLYLFLCGMLIAVGRWQGRLRQCLLFSLLLCVPYLGWPDVESVMKLGLVVLVYYLLGDGSLPSCKALDTGLGMGKRLLRR